MALRWFRTVLLLKYISAAIVATRSPRTRRETTSHWRGDSSVSPRKPRASTVWAEDAKQPRGLDLVGDAPEVSCDLGCLTTGAGRFGLPVSS